MAGRNLLMDMMNQPSTANVLANYREPQAYDGFVQNLLGPISYLASDMVVRPTRLLSDPAQYAEDTGTATAAGMVSMPDDIARMFGGELYGQQTRADLDAAMAKDPIAAFGGAALAPMPVNYLAKAATAAPKATTAGLAGTAVATGATAEGDTGEKSYSQKLMELQQQQNEAFQGLEGLRRDLSGTEDRIRQEIMAKPAIELQRLVGAKPDGAIGPQTRAKIDQYVTNEVAKAKREAEARLQSLQARYDTLGSQIDVLNAEESPQAVRERQMNSRIGELYPEETWLTQAGLATTGLAADIATRARGRRAYNAGVRGANAATEDAVRASMKAYDEGNLYEASRQYSTANNFDDLARSYRDPSSMPWGTITGFETAALAPDAIDYFRASVTGNDDLKNEVIEGVVGGEDRNFFGEPLANRMAISGGLGFALGKLGKFSTGALMPKEYPSDTATILRTMDDQSSGIVADRANLVAGDMKAGVGAKPPAVRKPREQTSLPPPDNVQNQSQQQLPQADTVPVTPEDIDLLTQRRAQFYGVPVTPELRSQVEMNYPTRWTLADRKQELGYAIPGAVAGGAALSQFDQLLNEYAQTVRDMDGDGDIDETDVMLSLQAQQR